MEIIFLLIIVSLLFIALLAGALFWAIKSGQFDDMERHGHEILTDDDKEVINKDDEASS
jgi:cbb3-type cytochrome oxidase maturation protein